MFAIYGVALDQLACYKKILKDYPDARCSPKDKIGKVSQQMLLKVSSVAPKNQFLETCFKRNKTSLRPVSRLLLEPVFKPWSLKFKVLFALDPKIVTIR